ncbi:hypothetical protein RCL_jg17543.t1 [Rhizophagus clarus]|uniref:Uncharacterized protein n=1 Tax=Rhizophagus clarus TaxID=94130 RepID=A0A8H3KYQ3_9GLOM|nr:hypothetical protein RCL_jg17543.t1 [Rhizophagus clarus]
MSIIQNKEIFEQIHMVDTSMKELYLENLRILLILRTAKQRKFLNNLISIKDELKSTKDAYEKLKKKNLI